MRRIAFLLVLFSLWPVYSEEQLPQTDIFDEARGKILRWKLEPGDVVEIKKISRQNVIITQNRQESEIDREVIHWITLNTLAKDNEKGYYVDASFSSQIRYLPKRATPYESDELFFSKFYIQPIGTYLVPGDQYMPNVRHIPVFPEKRDPGSKINPLVKGDKWSRPAEELFLGEKLYRIPMNANYMYMGKGEIKVENKVKILHKIRINLAINYKIPDSGANDPVQIFGYSTALLAWDEKEGIPYYMQEEINLTLLYRNGLSQEFSIQSVTYYNKKKSFSDTEKNKMVKKLQDAVKGEEGAKITKSESGIKIELPDVFFDFDSDQLTPESLIVLNKVAKVLEAYPEKRILIKGHTDSVGDAEYNYELSRNRALRVLKYLVSRSDALKLDNFSYFGAGSDSPVAPNDTQEGRKKNRRVEIIILDN